MTSTETGTRRKRTRLIVIVAIVAAALLIGAIAAIVGGGEPEKVAAATPSPSASADASAGADAGRKKENPAAPLERRAEGDPMALGEVDAPVVILEYADFTCKYCGAFAQETLPTVIDEYVDAGKVRIEWRDLPVLSENSMHTAVAGRAAAEQGKFWEMYDAMYTHTYEGGAWSRDQTIEIAKQVDGLDVAAFTAALDDPKIHAAVQQEAQDSKALGFNSTPMFIVGGYLLQGAQPVDLFRQAIDQALDDAS